MIKTINEKEFNADMIKLEIARQNGNTLLDEIAILKKYDMTDDLANLFHGMKTEFLSARWTLLDGVLHDANLDIKKLYFESFRDNELHRFYMLEYACQVKDIDFIEFLLQNNPVHHTITHEYYEPYRSIYPMLFSNMNEELHTDIAKKVIAHDEKFVDYFYGLYSKNYPPVENIDTFNLRCSDIKDQLEKALRLLDERIRQVQSGFAPLELPSIELTTAQPMHYTQLPSYFSDVGDMNGSLELMKWLYGIGFDVKPIMKNLSSYNGNDEDLIDYLSSRPYMTDAMLEALDCSNPNEILRLVSKYRIIPKERYGYETGNDDGELDYVSIDDGEIRKKVILNLRLQLKNHRITQPGAERKVKQKVNKI